MICWAKFRSAPLSELKTFMYITPYMHEIRQLGCMDMEGGGVTNTSQKEMAGPWWGYDNIANLQRKKVAKGLTSL